MKKWMILVLIGLVTVSCKQEGGNIDFIDESRPVVAEDYVTSSLSGNINGEDWIFRSGRLKRSWNDINRYSIELWEEYHEDPCHVWSMNSERYVFGTIDAKIGETVLSFEETMTMYYTDHTQSGGMNIIITNGKISLGAVEDGVVQGKVLLRHDDDNYVNGEFEITYCD